MKHATRMAYGEEAQIQIHSETYTEEFVTGQADLDKFRNRFSQKIKKEILSEDPESVFTA